MNENFIVALESKFTFKFIFNPPFSITEENAFPNYDLIFNQPSYHIKLSFNLQINF